MILRWLLNHPVATILIIIIGSGIIEFGLVWSIDAELKLKQDFTEADILVMGSVSLILGIYCGCVINSNKQEIKT